MSDSLPPSQLSSPSFLLQQTSLPPPSQKQPHYQPNIGFLAELKLFSQSRIARLTKTIFGDLQYPPKNKYNLNTKQKIFAYLEAKNLTSRAKLQDEKSVKFTSFNPDFATAIHYKTLIQMKQTLSKLKTNIEAAEDTLKQSQIGQSELKTNFLNEVAFEFSRQRKAAICWGLLLGSFICSTIYRRGSAVRKAALFLTTGHIFGQIAYRTNCDKFLDTVFSIYEEDALQYMKMQKQENAKTERTGARGNSYLLG